MSPANDPSFGIVPKRASISKAPNPSSPRLNIMENKNELADALLYIVDLCGYYPLNETQIDILVKYITRDDPTLTAIKLKEKFKLAIEDKLGIELKGRLSASGNGAVGGCPSC